MCLPMLLIHFFCYFGKRKRFLPPSAYLFLTSSVHVLHCLSRFAKKKNIRIRSKEKHKKISSLRVRVMIAQFKCSKPLFTVEERFSSRLVVLLQNLKQKVAQTGRLLDCFFYKAKTKVITKRCTTGHRAIEHESQERKKKQKINRRPKNDLE